MLWGREASHKPVLLLDRSHPDTYVRFCTLQDNVPTFSTMEARVVLEDGLGRPVDTIFEWLSEEPLAAASLGQVSQHHFTHFTPGPYPQPLRACSMPLVSHSINPCLHFKYYCINLHTSAFNVAVACRRPLIQGPEYS